MDHLFVLLFVGSFSVFMVQVGAVMIGFNNVINYLISLIYFQKWISMLCIDVPKQTERKIAISCFVGRAPVSGVMAKKKMKWKISPSR